MGFLLLIVVICLMTVCFRWLKKSANKNQPQKLQQPKKMSSSPIIQETIPKSPIVTTPTISQTAGKCPADYIAKLEEEQTTRREKNVHYNLVVIDFETTGLSPILDEILQVSVIDDEENVLINQYCKPQRCLSWVDSSRINGIWPNDVQFNPAFKEIAPYVQDILCRADTVIAYNCPFEQEFLRENKIDPDALKWGTDPMKLAAKYYNRQFNSRRSKIRLSEAAEMVGYKYNPHDALEDVKATLQVYKFLTTTQMEFTKIVKKSKDVDQTKGAKEAIKRLEEAKQKRESEGAHYDVVFMDVEGTSYNTAERNEILQIAIIDKNKNVLINQYCKPKKESWERAAGINSIYPETVENCPDFKSVKLYAEDILNRSDKIVAFDKLVVDYLDRYKVDRKRGIESPVYKLREYNKVMGIENPQWTTLEDAASQLGLVYDFNDALEDAKATSDIYTYVKAQEDAVKAEIARNKVDSEMKAKYAQNIDADRSNYFYNKKIAFVDSLPVSRDAAYEKVSNCGALIRLTVTPTLDILVCGTRSPMMRHIYGEISSEQKKAEKLNISGANIEIMSGEKFIKILDQIAGRS